MCVRARVSVGVYPTYKYLISELNLTVSVASDPRDIDLFTGLLTEKQAPGSTVGPTLECLLGRQFNALKCGDRFWYQGTAAAFSAGTYTCIRSPFTFINYNFTIKGQLIQQIHH